MGIPVYVPILPLTVLAVTAVTPPAALLANVGTTCPLGASGLPSDLAAAIRFARGTYGVYVVVATGTGIPATPANAAGCCGGGGRGPVRIGGGRGSGGGGGRRGGDVTAAARRAAREPGAGAFGAAPREWNEFELLGVNDVGLVGNEITELAGDPVTDEFAELRLDGYEGYGDNDNEFEEPDGCVSG
jgi:hypothetical protein